jgi:hypothetical protein
MPDIQIRSLDQERCEVSFTRPVAVPASLLVRDDDLELDLLTIAGDSSLLSVRGSFERILDFLSSGHFQKEVVRQFLSIYPKDEII